MKLPEILKVILRKFEENLKNPGTICFHAVRSTNKIMVRKLTFGLMATITLKRVPFHAYSAPHAILPGSPKLCQNGGVSSSNGETKKSQGAKSGM